MVLHEAATFETLCPQKNSWKLKSRCLILGIKSLQDIIVLAQYKKKISVHHLFQQTEQE